MGYGNTRERDIYFKVFIAPLRSVHIKPYASFSLCLSLSLSLYIYICIHPRRK